MFAESIIEHFRQANQYDTCLLVFPKEVERGGNGNRSTMVAAHAVNREGNGHQRTDSTDADKQPPSSTQGAPEAVASL